MKEETTCADVTYEGPQYDRRAGGDHCVLTQVLHNCVGRGNMRYFTLYTASLLGGQLLFL